MYHSTSLQTLEGRKMSVDAARDEHLLRLDVLQQFLIQHVLPICEDIREHVHLKYPGEELRDRVVIAIASVEVRARCEE